MDGPVTCHANFIIDEADVALCRPSLSQTELRTALLLRASNLSKPPRRSQHGFAPTPLLLALAHLLKGSPPQLYSNDLPDLLPWILAALSYLQQGPLQQPAVLLFLLLACGHTLMEGKGKPPHCSSIQDKFVQSYMQLAHGNALSGLWGAHWSMPRAPQRCQAQFGYCWVNVCLGASRCSRCQRRTSSD